MANPEHLEIIQKGTSAWNEWRANHPEVWPDLIDARLPSAKLDSVNLENANLLKADLRNASLVGAQLRNSNLRDASLVNADLTGADLQEANLYGARLAGANLERAVLRHANLLKASFDRTIMAFSTFGSTSFDHGLIEGSTRLGTIYHDEPSIVSMQIFEATARFLQRRSDLMQSTHRFFENAGIPEQMLKGLRKTPKAKNWYSCFVSYSHSSKEDREFVEKLCHRLGEAKVPLWRDTQGLSYGALLEEDIPEAINYYDRTLACCSKVSLKSSWVNKELNMVAAKETQVRRAVLLPLDVDGYLDNLDEEEKANLMPYRFHERFIANFREWRNDEKFEDSAKKLLDALKPVGS